LFQRALDLLEKALGPEHVDVATSLSNLATVYRFKGDYAKAEPLYQRALNVYEKTVGTQHLSVVPALWNLANLYRDIGNYDKAEVLYKRELAIREKAQGEQHPQVASSLNSLANLYYYKGDYTQAEQLFRRALTIFEKTLGPEHPNVTVYLNNLANLYRAQGEYAKSESLLQRALNIQEKRLGAEHPFVAASLHSIASLYYDKGDIAKAEPLLRRALNIREKILGPEHPDVAASLNNLASLYGSKGELIQAEPMYQRALEVWEKALGPNHSFVASLHSNRAMSYRARGEAKQAIVSQTRSNEISELNLSHNLISGSERQKLAYLALFSKETNSTLSLHSQSAPDNPQALDLALTTLLRRKGRGLDAMTDTIATLRRHAIPQDQELFDQLVEARSQLAALTLRETGAAKPDSYQTRLKPIEEKVEKLEAELSARSAAFRAESQPVTPAAVQAALPAGGALVEFAVYTPIEPKNDEGKPPRYLAYALASQGAPRWVDLGEAAPIDRAIDAWRKALRDPGRNDVRRLARTVDEKVMRPVRALLGETRRVLIAPDGLLNLIPFSALVDEGNRYLVERYAISYLTSGRDLLRLPHARQSKTAPMVVANPAFGKAATIARQTGQNDGGLQAGNQGDRARLDTTRVFFQPLPGTEDEAIALKAILPEATVLMRERATEAEIKRASAPSILHIATHGFFLADQEAPPVETRGVVGEDLRLSRWAAKVENPLLRSGLVLAGANQGKSGDDDGILTALEAAGLDLWGTKLVVLSACDTGVGEVKNGEGVYGLRRALALAGSESQVMSLWPVPDEATKDLMIPYYKALKQRQGRGEGLRQVQLQMLKSKNRRHPFYWAGFIQSGEWANLEGKR
jgi:CHAT domain-containing protein/Tfp pilus assembly protein PilF